MNCFVADILKAKSTVCKPWKRAACQAMAILAVENFGKAEATSMVATHEDKGGFSKQEVFFAVVVVLFFSYGVQQVVIKMINFCRRCVQTQQTAENRSLPETLTVEKNVQVSESSQVPEERYETKNDNVPVVTYVRPSHVAVPASNAALSYLSPAVHDMWRGAWEAVKNEPKQADWWLLSKAVIDGEHGVPLRDWWFDHCGVRGRMKRYYGAHGLKQNPTENSVKTWHRTCNMVDIRFMEGYLQAKREENRKHAETVVQQYREQIENYEVIERDVQGPVTYQGRCDGSGVYVELPARQWGSEEHRSAFNTRD